MSYGFPSVLGTNFYSRNFSDFSASYSASSFTTSGAFNYATSIVRYDGGTLISSDSFLACTDILGSQTWMTLNTGNQADYITIAFDSPYPNTVGGYIFLSPTQCSDGTTNPGTVVFTLLDNLVLSEAITDNSLFWTYSGSAPIQSMSITVPTASRIESISLSMDLLAFAGLTRHFCIGVGPC